MGLPGEDLLTFSLTRRPQEPSAGSACRTLGSRPVRGLSGLKSCFEICPLESDDLSFGVHAAKRMRVSIKSKMKDI